MRSAYLFYRHFLLGTGLLLGTTAGAFAQTAPDTTHLHYSEEPAPRAWLDPALRVQREERSQWKLGLNNFLLGTHSLSQESYYTRYGVHLAYERQVGGPAWSVLGEVSPAITHYRPDISQPLESALSVRAQLAGRYYYNRERRLLQGRRTGSFSANYLSVALGAGLGRGAHESPFYQFRAEGGRLVNADLALLYGWQRRLGRHGFLDANVGFTSRLWAADGPAIEALNTSLRVGLLLGSPPAYPTRPVPADADESLRPRLYVGARAGVYGYRVHYSTQYPYPPDVEQRTPQQVEVVHYGYYQGEYGEGYGTYADYLATLSLPYLYAGYYLRPRLAVQVGVQREVSQRDNSTYFDTPTGFFSIANGRFERRNLALPVLLRYALTPAFLRRWQFDAVGGLVPVWSSAEFREYLISNQQLTNQQTFEFQRRTFSVHGSLGLDAAYGFGHRRRVQATLEAVLNKDLRTLAENESSLQGGFSLGLRYRFGYQ